MVFRRIAQVVPMMRFGNAWRCLRAAVGRRQASPEEGMGHVKTSAYNESARGLVSVRPTGVIW